MTRLKFQRAAELELNRAVIWYEERKVGLGRELLAEVRKAITDIRARPESFPLAYRIARRASVHRFPYAVYFTTTEGLISVLAVLHGAQDVRRHLRGRVLMMGHSAT